MKVLIVDDSTTVRQQVAAALGDTGLEVIEAEDGVDGLEKLDAHDDVGLVLCDVNMPRMNGLDMIAVVSRTERHAGIPLIVLTTEGQPELMRRAKGAGAKAWIIKPFKPDVLAAVVQKFAALRAAGGTS